MILVDDGSTDGSSGKCDQWQLRDDRIIVIHKPNGGLSDARNAGLNIAAGDYIGFVDSDDWVETDMFELLVSTLKRYDADVSGCRFTYVYEDGKRETFGDDHQICVFEGVDGLKEYLFGKTVDPFVCNKLYRANSIQKTRDRAYPVRFIQGVIGEDNPFNVEILKHSNRVVVVDEAKYNYLQKRAGAITSSKVSRKKIDSIFWWDTIRQECCEQYPELEIYAIRRMALFYFGLYKEIHCDSKYKSEAKSIRSFARKYWKRIVGAEICEKPVKLATVLMASLPELYVVLIRCYQSVKGEVRL